MRIVEKLLDDVLVISPTENCGDHGSTSVFSVNQLAALGITDKFI